MSTNEAPTTPFSPPAPDAQIARSDAHELLLFIGANLDVARADEAHHKIGPLETLLKTAKALVVRAEAAGELS